MATKAKSIAAVNQARRSAGALSQTIAWQGAVMAVPEGWSLVAASGDERSGSLRVEQTGDVDADAPLGMEVRWSDIKQPQTAEMLDKRIKPLLDAARKTAKKAKIEPETSVGAYDDKRHSDRGTVREFHAGGKVSGRGRIWRCATCGRLMIVQVYGHRGNRYQDRAKELLAAMECHGEEEGWTRWALYGLDVMVPSEYGLVGQQLMNIYLELRFTRGRAKSKQGDTITIEQWSAANVQLKGAYLDDWFERKGHGLQRTLKVEKLETAVHGHDALRMTGRRTGLAYWMGDAVKQLSSMHMPATRYSSIGWECANSNKVFLVQSLSAKRSDAVVLEIADRTRCHHAQRGL